MTALVLPLKGKRSHHYRTDPLVKKYDARLILDYFDPDTDDVAIAAALGCNRAMVNKWRNGKSVLISPYRADRYAIRIGLHPSLVWGAEWWNLDGEERA
jgi:hypothetical protein